MSIYIPTCLETDNERGEGEGWWDVLSIAKYLWNYSHSRVSPMLKIARA